MVGYKVISWSPKKKPKKNQKNHGLEEALKVLYFSALMRSLHDIIEMMSLMMKIPSDGVSKSRDRFITNGSNM